MDIPKSFNKAMRRITDQSDIITEWFGVNVKKQLFSALVDWLSQYPTAEPRTQNSLVWTEILDEYLKNEQLDKPRRLVQLGINAIINEQEDPPWRQRLDFILRMIHEAILDDRYILDEGEYSWGKKAEPNVVARLISRPVVVEKFGTPFHVELLNPPIECACGAKIDRMHLIKSRPDTWLATCTKCYCIYTVDKRG